jgi:hypothetical protein
MISDFARSVPDLRLPGQCAQTDQHLQIDVCACILACGAGVDQE